MIPLAFLIICGEKIQLWTMIPKILPACGGQSVLTAETNLPQFSTMAQTETEQDPMVLAPHILCLYFVCGKIFSQRIRLMKEAKTCRNKRKQSKELNNHDVVIKHNQGPLILS